MEWHWDERKAKANRLKHGLSFETAIEVFDDPHHLTFPNEYREEIRWETYGWVNATTLVVVHTVYDDESGGRIISARRATAHERRKYEEGI
jgi:uncharacterized protein